ncbi:RNA polymerase I termination factor [Cercospora beticola]|uniref:RNA polymerase I termination factor n=1 Tax=Cercospora beticola TaxID=122368 RepID=A0A2G5HUD6_CERBT|nr:RNA polymerase I termination factor [Cercospora beticola]PIA96164.1 RNA polymerase I termination factor [Cercospora beticola]WPB07240.1 hypothetical protein RHO25_011901 [Cercospora beticola]
MGQSSSQITQQSQQIVIARTPTPELSDVDREAARGQPNESNVMETLSDHDHTTTIHWSPINVPRPNTADAPPLSQTIPSSQPTSSAPAKVPKKRVSQSSQRRLLSPRVVKVVPSVEGSDEEVQPQQKKRKALPKAARSEEDAAPARSGQVKADRRFSPLRQNKPRTTARRSPTPYHSPVPPPPQVVIPSSEILEATQAQALLNHVEELQGQLSRAQSQLQSPDKHKHSQNGPDALSATGKSVLAELQNNNQGSDWFSKIDEAVAEVEAAQSRSKDADQVQLAVGQISEAEERGAAPDQAEGPASSGSTVPSTTADPVQGRSIVSEMKASSEEIEDDQGTPGTEIEQAEESEEGLEDDSMDDDAGEEQAWPEPTEDQVTEYMRQRKLTADDLETEEPIANPQGEWETRENKRRAARNALREYIVECSLERELYKGLAKYVINEEGETSVVYAARGEKFPIAKHTKSEKREAKAKKEGMKSTKHFLHESIAQRDLELRMMAEQRAANSAAPQGVEHVSVTVPTAQSPDSGKESLGQQEHSEDPMEIQAEDEEQDRPETQEDDHDQPEDSVSLQEDDDDVEAHSVVDAAQEDVAGTEDGDPEAEEIEVNKAALGQKADEVQAEVMHADAAKDTEAGAQADYDATAPDAVDKPRKTTRSKGKKAAISAKEPPSAVVDTSTAAKSPDPVVRKQRKVARPPRVRVNPALAVPAVIPTPPTSDQGAHLLNTATQTSNVDEWLAGQSQEPPVPPEELEQSVPDAKISRKRKRNSGEADFEVPPNEVATEDSDSMGTVSSAAAQEATRSKNKRRREHEVMASGSKPKKRKSNDDGPEKPAKPKRRVTMSGPFTQEEKELADKIFESAMQKEGLSEAQLMAQVQNWKTCGCFKTDMFAAFSDRSVESVRKFCQRRYHGQQRGPWTPEDDEALRSAYARYPLKWTAISDLVGRTAQDCKDRWRNHFEFAHKVLGPWTIEEEEQLLAAVEECIDVIKNEQRDDRALLRDRERLEALINWKVVSDKLEGKRTTKRCREKYLKLRASQAKAKNNDVSWSTTQRARDDDNPSKVAQAKRALKEFEIGDYYDVFVEIHSSFDNPHQHFRDEKNVVWSIVSSKNMHSRFSLFSYASPLRRVALEHAIANWPTNSAKIKRRLEKVDTIPAKALVLARWVEKHNAGNLDAITRTFRTELIGKTKEEIDTIRKSRKERFGQGPRKNNGKSRDYVTESESEDDMEDVARIPAEVLDDEDDTHESDDDVKDDHRAQEAGHSASEEDEDPSEVTQQVPDTQFEDTGFVTSDAESLKGSPNMAPSAFMDKLKSSGGSSKRKSIGYGKRDRVKAEKRRSKAH